MSFITRIVIAICMLAPTVSQAALVWSPCETITAGHFYLSQNSNGGLTGRMSGYPSTSCGGTDEFYNMNGAFNSSCATASGSWSNDRGLSGPLTMTQGCQVPTGETPSVFTGWHSVPGSSFNLTAADYNVTPAPTTTYNWGGRTIAEEFLQPPNDTCWY
jgi:hypothetical protein